MCQIEKSASLILAGRMCYRVQRITIPPAIGDLPVAGGIFSFCPKNV